SLLFAIEWLAEPIGGAPLSSFVNCVLSQEVLDFFFKENNSLTITLLSADILLNDAEKKQLKEPNVVKWLDERKRSNLRYEADHVMDKINTEALRPKLEKGKSGSKACKCFNFFPMLLYFA
ncbi:hypothetical protein PanWU01x14_370880, partial [Parasponia andersonii]